MSTESEFNVSTGSSTQILIITDSLGFPRVSPEFVQYSETYIALLKAKFRTFDFIHIGRGGGTIVDLFKHTNYFHGGTIKPTLVLMQSGVVDCAPRALTEIEQHILARLPIAGPWIGAIVKRHVHRLRRWRNMTYTPLPTFEDYVNRFEGLYTNVHWIGILPADAEYERVLNGMTDNINKYNNILRTRSFVATDDFTSKHIMTDFHHLNRAGHEKLFERLAKVVENQMCTSRSDPETASEAGLFQVSRHR